MKDEKLLELLRSDPSAGMDQLIRRYSGLIFAIVRERLAACCDSSEIEDCVTDVFLKFRSGLPTFVPKASLKNYLGVIARNTAEHYRRNRVPTEPLEDEDGFFIEIPDSVDVAEEVAREQALEALLDEIRRLGPPDSDILIRKYYLGQSSKKIAGDLKMTVSNVDTRAHRAGEKLRNKFGGKP